MRLFLLTAVIMVAFAANSVLTRAGVSELGLDAVWFGTIRLMAGAWVLVALALLGKQDVNWRPALDRWAVVGLVLYIYGFSLAYQSLDSGLGALVLFGMVQISMFAGSMMGGERPTALRWIGAAVAFGGLIYVLRPTPDTDISLVHAGLMVVAGLGWGIYSLAGRKARDPLLSSAVNFALASGIGLVLALLLPTEGINGHWGGVALAFVSGAVTSGLGYALWYSVLPKIQASLAAVAQLTVPLIAMAGGMIFLAEPLTMDFVIAAALVLGGVGLSLLRPKT